MGDVTIEGIIVTPLKQIFHPRGDVLHAMKMSDKGFAGFAEAYFSTIHCGEIKIWKKHLLMTLNFVVPVGRIRIVVFDDRNNSSTYGNFFDITLSQENYQRITIPPGVWVAFSGIGSELNLLLNIANMEHDPNEIVRKEKLGEIEYTWQEKY
jgi:dTDP-4-dehydrorhamnose 3,5-epimerase